jgi:hypothetical protein
MESNNFRPSQYPIYIFANDLFKYFNRLGRELDKIIKEKRDKYEIVLIRLIFNYIIMYYIIKKIKPSLDIYPYYNLEIKTRTIQSDISKYKYLINKKYYGRLNPQNREDTNISNAYKNIIKMYENLFD